jgi:hypothetical protein
MVGDFCVFPKILFFLYDHEISSYIFKKYYNISFYI